MALPTADRIAEHRRAMEALGLQPVICRSKVRDDGTVSPVPISGTTRAEDRYGVWVDPPSGRYDRLAFRVPPDAVVLDVDQKPGGADGVATLARMETELGFLPPTQRLTSRGGEQRSGRLLFRVPEGIAPLIEGWARDEYGAGEAKASGIDVLRNGHRFSMAPGDMNPNSGGSVVRCYGPDGTEQDMLPWSQWPLLPDGWISAIEDWAAERQLLKLGRGEGGVISTVEARTLVEQMIERVGRHKPPRPGKEYRDDFLKAAKTMAGLMEAGLFDEDEIERRMLGACRSVFGAEAEMDEDEQQMVQDGIQYGLDAPFTIDDSEWSDDPEERDVRELDPLPEPDPKLVARYLTERVSREAAEQIYAASRMAEQLADGETGVDPVDLAALLSGETVDRERAELLVRSDGAGLVYRGKSHLFAGEGGSGKSFIAQAECAAAILRGENVVYLDFEDQASGVVGRLVNAFGVPPELVIKHLSYISPHASLRLGAGLDGFRTNVLHSGASVVVLDGVNASLGLEGLDYKDAASVETWFREIVNPICNSTGAAVLMIDHVVKNEENRGRFAIGSERKLSALTGAAYRVEIVDGLREGHVGRLKLLLSKDRPGAVAPVCGNAWAAGLLEAGVVLVDSTEAVVRLEVTAPDGQGQTPKERQAIERDARRDAEQDSIRGVLRGVPYRTTAQVVEAVGFRRARVVSHLAEMTDAGVLRMEQVGQEKRYSFGDAADDFYGIDPDDLL